MPAAVSFMLLALAFAVSSGIALRADAPATPGAGGWGDCLACHADPYSGLPKLSDLRPQSTSGVLEGGCLSCHAPAELVAARADWRHPVRPVGSHLACTNCHVAVAHGKGAPPPKPTGDYVSEGCYACHREVQMARQSMQRHGEGPQLRCIDCHSPHVPMLAALPAVLVSQTERERWERHYDWLSSNDGCLSCHPPAQLLMQLDQGFVTLNTVNYHDLHTLRGRVLCVECHAAHGSNRSAMLRGSLLTGESWSYVSGPDGGTCTVRCHGVDHDGWRYVNRVW
jgi:hypothetical protein